MAGSKRQRMPRDAAPFADLAALEAAWMPAWIFDSIHERMAWANRAALDLWGSPDLAELRARSFSDMSEASRSRLALILAQVRAGEQPEDEWTVYPRGRPLRVRVRRRLYVLPDGTPALLHEGMPVDPPVDPALLRGVEALHHTRELVSLYGKDGTALMRNPAAARLLGPVDRQPGRLGTSFVDEADRADLFATLSQGAVFARVLRVATTAGPAWYAVEARPATDPVDGSPAVLVNARDVTELQEARQRAEAGQRAKARFLAMMGHEIRTPMAGIIGLSDLLADAPLPGEHRTHLDALRRSARSLLAILNDVLDYSKVEGGDATPALADTDAAGLVREMVDLFAPVAWDKGLSLSAEVAAGVPRTLRLDGPRVRQVLFNLVSNAVKFTPAGRVTLSLSASPLPGGSWDVCMTVEDTGIGITAEQLSHLFQPFAQGDDSNTRRFGGAGLGLAVCRRVAEILGARITGEGQPGRGSRFRMCLRAEEGEAPAAPPTPAPTLPRPGRGARVLVADDNPVNRMLLAARLSRSGHHTVLAEDGAKALAAAREGGFDIILMDMQMPVMDGATATQAIRHLDGPASRVRIVGVSADAFPEQQAAYLRAGLDGYLTKPVDWDRLEAEIQGALRQSGITRDGTPASPSLASSVPDLAVPSLNQPALDPRTLRDMRDSLGDKTLAELFSLLDGMLDAELSRIRAAVTAGEPLEAAVHKLKGTAGNLGARCLADALSALGKASAESAPRLMVAVDQAVHRLREVIPTIAMSMPETLGQR